MNPMMILIGLQMAKGIVDANKAGDASASFSKANRDNAVTAQTDENAGLNAQEREQDEIMHSKRMAERLKAIHGQSQMQASSRNVKGVSIDRMENELQNMLSNSLTNARANEESRRRTLKLRKKGSFNKASSRINSTPAVRENPMNTLVSGGLSMASAYYGQKEHEADMDGKR